MIDEMEQLEQLCAAVPSPDRQRLTAARAQLSTAIRRETAGHAARRPWLAVSLALRHRWLSRRWLGWVAPLAAAAAVTGVILGSQGVFSPVHRPVPSSSTHDPGLGLAHPATAYVAGQSGTVTPILTATGTALKPIRIGKEYGQISSAIVFRPDGKTAYVLSSTVLGGGSGTVTPIRTASNTALKPIAVGQDPRALAITPDGTTIYVTNYESGTVTPIRTATNTALAPINVPEGSFNMAITPDGTTIYVLDLGSSQHKQGLVIPIRTATNTALRPITIGPAWPFVITIAITPDSKTAYVTNAYTDTVTPIRTATNTALAPIKVGESPVAIAITPDGQTAYVVNFTSGPGRPGIVIPIQTATNQALRPIQVGYLPGTIAITP